MARPYPRFIYADPHNTKSSGPFIVHTLPPQLIAKVTFNDEGFHLIDALAVFTAADERQVDEVIYQMHRWLTAQRMEEAKLSPDFYEHLSTISDEIVRLRFFENVATSITFKPLMGAKLEVGRDNWKVEIAFANEDNYYSVVQKLKAAYQAKYDLVADWRL